MNKKLIRPVLVALALLLGVLNASAQQQLFSSASNNQPGYRIPSIVRYPSDKTGALKGGLWAFADLRYKDGDIGNNNRIDIIGRKLEDGAKVWKDPIIIVPGNANASDYSYAFGDAATVVDRESGKILLMSAAGKNSVWVSTGGYPNVARSIYNPETGKWSTTEVTKEFYGKNNVYANHLFVSSGRMIQSTIYKKDKYYRIYAGICTVSGNGSRVAYSDDFGETWNYLGGYSASPISEGDECKVEELPDGSILLNAKRYNKKEQGKTYYGRCTNIFTFTNIATGEGTWGNVATSGASNTDGQTFTANCNAEIMLVPAKKTSDNSQTYLLLLAGPASTNRTNGSVYWKELPSSATEYRKPSNYVSGWTKYVWGNQNTGCGYITMTLDKDGNIAMLDENGGIHYQNLSLSTITNGAYTYHRSAKGTYKTTAEPIYVQRPSLNLNGGIYTTDQKVTITKPEGITVYYTLDGSDPVVPSTTTTSGAKALQRVPSATNTKEYTTPITLTEGATTLKAVAVDDYSGNVSQVVSASYLITSESNTTTSTASKTGTTISLDHNSATNLFTNNGTGSFWAYLRHNSTHIQLISSTVAELEPGQPIFHVTNNNMVWGKKPNYYLELYNGRENGKDVTRYGYYAIVAPQGYRFLRYKIVMDKSSENGAKLDQYTYQSGSNTQINIVNTATASSSGDVTLERTMTEGTNALYFRMDGQTADDQNPIVIKTLELTYAIDNPFSAQVPNANGTKIHSGFIDMGTFSKGEGNKFNYGFSNSHASDLENVKVVKTDGSAPQNVTVDNTNYFMATSDGDYYIEAPAKFRIVGATVNTKRGSVTLGSYENYTPSTSASNKEIVFKSPYSDNYLMISNGNGVNTSNLADATKFRISYDASHSGYTIVTQDNKYLYIVAATNDNKATLRTSDEAKYWGTNSNKLYFTVNNKKQYIICTTNNVWGDSWKVNNEAYPTIQSTPTYSAGDFKATVYNRENTGVADNGELSVTETSTPSVTVSDMNNDAIHINLSGISSGSAALFNVSLQLLPLDPEVSSVEAAAKIDNKVVGNSPVTSYNYIFNNGNVIGVPVPSTTGKDANIDMVFRNATNEEQTLWYTTGNNQNNPNVKGGYSNVYIIGSTADKDNGLNVTSPYPDARTAVDVAGVNKVYATNIDQLADEKNTAVNTLQDNTVDATTAGNTTISMTINNPTSTSGTTEDKQTFYLYSADQPTYQIMPKSLAQGKHIDFRFFTIKVKPVVAETPSIEIVPIYTTTMKGAQHKTQIASDQDDPQTKTYVGIKVTAQKAADATTSYNALTAEEVYTAMVNAMKEKKDEYNISETDPLRTVLYVDMSGLSAVTTANSTTMANYATQTADNCLYFMPQGFAGSGLQNVISKQSDGSYQSFGDVRVWDQQPFYTPYAFNTGTYKAIYEREGTVSGENVKAKVRNMAAVLPFSITLDGQGHPILDGSDHSTSYITFHNVTSSGELTGVLKDHHDTELTYAVVAQKETGNTALANHPYYVTIEKGYPEGFTFNVPGAQFASSVGVAGQTMAADKLKATNGTWTALGTYCGGTVAKAENLWYFSKDLFWKSYNLTNYNVVNVRPFRAYFTTTANTGSHAKATVVFNLDDIITTGINGIKAGNSTEGKVYTIDGYYVGTSLQGLAPGIYIQNGRKIVKK